MGVYLLCKGRFSCDGNGQEGRLEPRFPHAAFSLALTLVSICGFSCFFLEMKFLFICIHNFVRVSVSVEQN